VALRQVSSCRISFSHGQDPDCVKTLRGIIAPGILTRGDQESAKIFLPLGITTKSDFGFTRLRPKVDIRTGRVDAFILFLWPLSAEFK
jgi:hypothetical protein